jgi:multisubunit Na+/H+ antiporter MnhC subunit
MVAYLETSTDITKPPKAGLSYASVSAAMTAASLVNEPPAAARSPLPEAVSLPVFAAVVIGCSLASAMLGATLTRRRRDAAVPAEALTLA